MSSGIGIIQNNRQDCFINVNLQAFTLFPELLSRTLTQQQDETVKQFKHRKVLQLQVKDIVDQLNEGKKIGKNKISDLRNTLTKLNFIPRLNCIQQILMFLFPCLFNYESGDVFKLYNQLKNAFEEIDCSLEECEFFAPALFCAGATLHTSQPISDIGEYRPRIVQINMNQSHIPQEILKSNRVFYKLNLIQCTVATRSGYHCFVIRKKDNDWFKCNDDKLTKLDSFSAVQTICQKAANLHLFYQ
jgi:hypothetical protein